MSQYKTLLSCTQSCCIRSDCNVVFFHNDSCFHITCHTMKSCEPMKRTGGKYSKSSMILIRNADQNSDDSIFATDYNDNPNAVEEYTESKQRREDSIDSIVNDYMSGNEAERPLRFEDSDRICTIGESDCATNELCKKSSNRRRQGICVCRKGWHRNERHVCQPESLQYRSSDPTLDKYAAEEDPKLQPLNEQQSSIDTDSKVLKINESTGGSTHVVVSAGRNQTIQLPKDEVTLSAFVLPSSQSYKY
ncbi:unnamed protein product, partial [Medioppia subpectinata]